MQADFAVKTGQRIRETIEHVRYSGAAGQCVDLLDLVVFAFAEHSQHVIALLVRLKRGRNDDVFARWQFVLVADLTQVDERRRLRRRVVCIEETSVQRARTVRRSL